MKCFSCNKQKNQIFAKKSDIIDDVTNYMCQLCIDSKFEPRWIIVLAGRSLGTDCIRDFIVKRRYLGPDITAQELIP